MRIVIRGESLDIKNDPRIGSRTNGYTDNDPRLIEETLYKSPRGAFFLHTIGGPETEFGVRRSGSVVDWGEVFELLTDEEAQTWMKKDGKKLVSA